MSRAIKRFKKLTQFFLGHGRHPERACVQAQPRPPSFTLMGAYTRRPRALLRLSKVPDANPA